MNNINNEITAEIFAGIPTRAQLRLNELRGEIYDDEVMRFRNLRSLSVSDWEKFNCSTGHFKDTTANNDINEDDDVDEGGARKRKKKPKVHKQRSYHYKIGQYMTSAYYTKFLNAN